MNETKSWQGICEENYPLIDTIMELYEKDCPRYRRDDLYECLVGVLIHKARRAGGESELGFQKKLLGALLDAGGKFCEGIRRGGKIQLISLSDPSIREYPAYTANEPQAAA